MIFEYAVMAVLGLIIGSFLNVCIYRMPRGCSIIFPYSKCPSCDMPIRAIDNVPIISYILLGGKCRYCKARISFRYPAVEALNAALYAAVLYRYGMGWHLPVYLAFVSALVVITFIDLEFQIIPDRITLGGIPAALLAGAFLLPDPMSRAELLGAKASVIGAASGFGLFYAVALLSRGGMGGGDIKLMAMIGGLMGWKAVLMTTLLGSFTGSVLGIFLMLFRGKGRKTKIPFGPFLALGALIALLFGEEILRWYLRARFTIQY